MKTCKKCHIDYEGKNCPSCKAMWYQKNKKKVLARVLEWGRNHREVKNKHAANWHLENKEKSRANWQNRRARVKQAKGKLTVGIDKVLYALQKGKCACCRNDLNKYHLDHKMPIALGGDNTDENIQLLCPRCNLSKGAKHPIDFMQSIGYLL